MFVNHVAFVAAWLTFLAKMKDCEMYKVLPWLVLVIVGCGPSARPMPDAVEVSGSVNLAGAPVSDVILNLQPTGGGLPAVIEVKEGSFTAELTPGRYAYFFTEGKVPAAFKAIPTDYREASLEREQLVVSGQSTELIIEME